MPPRRAPACAAALLLTGVALAAPAHAAPQLGTWHAKQSRLSAAAQSGGRQGSGVLVAVIDTWVDGNHSAFGGRVLPGVDCTGGACDSAQRPDSCSHGTHVAGTVAASDYGVAPRAKVLPLQILKYNSQQRQCTGNTTDAAAAIRYAVERGAKVINLSVGGDTPLLPTGTAMPGAVAFAASRGVVVVFAAGNNEGEQASDDYGDDAVVVAATGPDGSLADYSQRGGGVDVAAPGGEPFDGTNCRPDGSDCVASTAPKGEYFAMAGTSMAAPHVAGLAALLLGQRPSRGRADVVGRITSTARGLSGAGHGLIDINAAVGARVAPAPARSSATVAPTRRPAPPPTRRPSPAPAASRVAKPTPKPSPTRSTTPSPRASITNAPLSPPTDPSADPAVLAAPGDDRRPGRAAPISVAGALLVGLLAGHATPLLRRRRAG